MPEGPEIRQAADALAHVLVGPPLTRIEYRVPRLRRRARALRGAAVQRVYARSKALLIEYDCGLTHYSHNQLYGEWGIRNDGDAPDARRIVLHGLGREGLMMRALAMRACTTAGSNAERASPVTFRRSDRLDAHGHAHAAADAERGEALLGAGTLHLVQQGGEDPRAGRADRVADGDGAAVDVDLGRVETQFAGHA